MSQFQKMEIFPDWFMELFTADDVLSNKFLMSKRYSQGQCLVAKVIFMKNSLLIVDDEAMLPGLIQEYLEAVTDMEIRVAHSGEDALVCIEKSKPDVCMVDLRLPGMDGNQFVLKALQVHPQCKCIIHTGAIDYTIPMQLQELGLTEQSILYKPVPRLQLYVEKIKAVLSA